MVTDSPLALQRNSVKEILKLNADDERKKIDKLSLTQVLVFFLLSLLLWCGRQHVGQSRLMLSTQPSTFQSLANLRTRRASEKLALQTR